MDSVKRKSGKDHIGIIPCDRKHGRFLSVGVAEYRYAAGACQLFAVDCNVVSSAAHFKKKYKIAGKLSYILGVMKEFFHHFGEPFRITAECTNGEIYKFDGEAMLCAICNGQWCGGSFHNSPLSDITDGELEMLLVRKMGRVAFLKMIGKYKKGTLIDRKTGKVIPKMQKYIVYKKIKKLTISGCKKICSDGEIADCTMAQISVLRGAVNYKV